MPSRTKTERAAQAVLDEFGNTTLPIPLEDVIRHLGATIVRQPMDHEVSGMIFRQGDAATIGINSSHNPRRQRFTAAHEVGHLRLHPGRALLVDSSIRVNFRDSVSSQASDTQEIEANAFAAALLMPSAAVHEHAAELQRQAANRSRERLVSDLARLFDVSTEAMGYRLLNLGIASST